MPPKPRSGFTWLFLNILDELNSNEAFFVLLYGTPNPLEYGFNVSINEFSINFYIQNAITSVLAHRITLKSSIRYLKTPTEFIAEAFERFLESNSEFGKFAGKGGGAKEDSSEVP